MCIKLKVFDSSQQFLNWFYINPGPTTSSKTVLFFTKQMLLFLYCEQCPLHRSSLVPFLFTFLSCNTRAGKPVICQSLEPGLRPDLLYMYYVGRAFNWFPSSVERRTSNVKRLSDAAPFYLEVTHLSLASFEVAENKSVQVITFRLQRLKNGWN